MKIFAKLGNKFTNPNLIGNKFTTNGVTYDLTRPTRRSRTRENRKAEELLGVYEDHQELTKADEKKVYNTFIVFDCSHQQQSLFSGDNLYRFFDVNDDGDISLSELATIIEVFSMDDVSRREWIKNVKGSLTLKEWEAKGQR